MENVNSKIDLILQRLEFLESEVKKIRIDYPEKKKPFENCAPLFRYPKPENTEHGERK